MPAAYAESIHLPCPTCQAEVNAYCTFTTNGHTFNRHAPCVERIRTAARKEAS